MERQNALKRFFFQCKCNRCEEVGDWQQKEAKLTGLRCPKCSVEVACNDDLQYVCPNKCWSQSHAQSLSLLQELELNITHLEVTKAKNFQKFLKPYEEQFSEFHRARFLILHAAAKQYTREGNEDQLRECLLKVIKMVEFHPLNEYFKLLCSILYTLRLKFHRKLKDEELEWMIYYGLDIEVARSLWNDQSEKALQIRKNLDEL